MVRFSTSMKQVYIKVSPYLVGVMTKKQKLQKRFGFIR